MKWWVKWTVKMKELNSRWNAIASSSRRRISFWTATKRNPKVAALTYYRDLKHRTVSTTTSTTSSISRSRAFRSTTSPADPTWTRWGRQKSFNWIRSLIRATNRTRARPTRRHQVESEPIERASPTTRSRFCRSSSRTIRIRKTATWSIWVNFCCSRREWSSCGSRCVKVLFVDDQNNKIWLFQRRMLAKSSEKSTRTSRTAQSNFIWNLSKSSKVLLKVKLFLKAPLWLL